MKTSAALLVVFGPVMAAAAFTTCPNVTLVHSLSKEVAGRGTWYDGCVGLEKQVEATTAEACKVQCHADMHCTVWQWVKNADKEHCWSGNVMKGCRSRGSSATALENFERDLIDGERIQHGFVKFVKANAKMETIGLKYYPEETGTEKEQIARCKEFCYTDVSCTVWQFAPKDAIAKAGCWLEHTDNKAQSTTTESDWAKAMVAGETIEHVCPAYVPPAGLPWEWIIPSIILGLIALAAILYLLQPKPKVKKTRAVKIEPKPEPVPVYFIPQPTVLIPQTSIVSVPMYQPTVPLYQPIMR